MTFQKNPEISKQLKFLHLQKGCTSDEQRSAESIQLQNKATNIFMSESSLLS